MLRWRGTTSPQGHCGGPPAPLCVGKWSVPAARGRRSAGPRVCPRWRLPWEAVPSMWGPPVGNRRGRGRGGCARRTHAYLMGARPPSPPPVCRKWSLPAARGRRSAVNPGLSPGVAVASGGCAQYVGPAGRGVGRGFVFISLSYSCRPPLCRDGAPPFGDVFISLGDRQCMHAFACARACARA